MTTSSANTFCALKRINSWRILAGGRRLNNGDCSSEDIQSLSSCRLTPEISVSSSLDSLQASTRSRKSLSTDNRVTSDLATADTCVGWVILSGERRDSLAGFMV